MTTVGAAYLKAGSTHITLGGAFFTGLSQVAITPLEADHPLVTAHRTAHEERAAELAAELAAGAEGRLPVLRVYAGTRTDDGMAYRTLGGAQEGDGPAGASAGGAAQAFDEYVFYGRLENLPIPEPDSGDRERLSGFLLLGLWNDYLVKDKKEAGPPVLVQSIEVEAPYSESWPPRSHTDIFIERKENEADAAYARRVIERFATRAFRRPAGLEITDRYFGFWETIAGEYSGLEDSVKEVLVAILCSPRFLFLAEIENADASDGNHAEEPEREASDWALASRLSYFLWNSSPDEQLRSLAAAGELRQHLDAEVKRMLDDPRRRRFLVPFTEEWLRLDRLERMTINPAGFPAFTRFVKRDMREETLAFMDWIVANDLPVSTLIDSDFAMLNQNLAEFYGIPGVSGPEFRRVEIDRSEGRGGLLSQGSFLAGHSDGTQPHPILRAVWVKDRLLGDPPPPPPPNVPDLDPDTPGFEKLTLKEQLELHRDSASCRDCHAGIDPYGIAFEEYNAVGLLQPMRKGRPVDAKTTLPNGTHIEGTRALKDYLLSIAVAASEP